MNGRDSEKSIRIDNLGIGYQSASGGKPFIRKGIFFSGCRGEMIALIGLNGIGKSTLLRTIAGLQKRLSGGLFFGEKPAEQFSHQETARLISFVSTEPVRVANMRVIDLVAFGRFPYTGWLGNLTHSDEQLIAEAIEKAGLQHLAHKPVTQLSDGERQRTMIARAVAQDTPLIILDEPTAFLDISNKYAIFRLLQDLARHHQKTVILSTHDLHIALREMDKLWIMLENETLEGAPEEAVLNGWLNHLFPDENVGFNPLDGEFFFRKKMAGKAVVHGDGLPYLLTVRALERKGYEITPGEPADCTITVDQHSRQGEISWELARGGAMQKFCSIYNLLAEL